MTIIIEIIHNYTIVLELVNILVLIINLSLLLFQKKNKWHDYIILLYGGFLFGLIPLFVVFSVYAFCRYEKRESTGIYRCCKA